MARFILRRVVAAVVLLVLVATATFGLVQAAPGQPIELLALDPRVGPEFRAELIRQYGLDQPVTVQWARWMTATLRGELGLSFSQKRPVSELLMEGLGGSAWLMAGALFVLYIVALPLGIVAGLRPGSRVDRAILVFSQFFWALPGFVLAVVLLEILGVRLGWFPLGLMQDLDAERMSSMDRLLNRLHHLFLPSLVLGLSSVGLVIGFVRSGLIGVLASDHVRAARARGLSESRVLFRHALPNTLAPVIQHFGVLMPALLSGALIIEVVFSWPGLGRIGYAAIVERDIPVVLGTTLLSAAVVIMGSLLADLLHAWIDPRARDA
ncbi:MAG: ABC transporter permease [Acidobacteriota bacterium]